MQSDIAAVLLRMSFQASSQPLHERVKNELNKFRNNPDLKVNLIRQLYLKPPGQVPKELIQAKRFADLTDEQKRTLYDKGVSELSLFDKLGVLMCSVGIQRVCQIVKEREEQAHFNQEEAMAEYEEEASRWTEGVVTCYQLNGLRTLRTLLFAELETCWRLEGSNGKEVLEMQRDRLIQTFDLIESACEAPGKIVDVQQDLAAAITFAETYREQMGTGAVQLNLDQRRHAVQQMRQILQLLQKGFQDPYHLLPFLFQPIRVQPVSSEIDFVTSISPEALKWLSAFQRAFSFQASSFPKVLKGHMESCDLLSANRAIFLKAEKACSDLVKFTEPFVNDLQKLLNQWFVYIAMPPEQQYQNRDKLQKLLVEIDRIKPQLLQFHEVNRNCRNAMQVAIDLFKGRENLHSSLTWLYGSSIHQPVNNLTTLGNFCWSSLYNSRNLYEHSFDRLKDLLVPPYNSVPHVTTIDLLQCQTEEALLNVLEKLGNGQISGTGDMADLIETLQLLKKDYNSIFNAMRRYYHERKHRQGRSFVDFHIDAQCLTKLSDHLKTVEGLLKARQPKAVMDVLGRCEKLTKFLLPLLAYERWPELLVSSPFSDNSQKKDPFHAVQSSNLRRSFLKIDPQNFHKALQQFLHNKPIYTDETAFIQELLKASEEVVNVLNIAQKAVKESKPEDARHFWNNMVQCQKGIANALEKIQQKIEFHCDQNPDHSPLLEQIQSEYLSRMAGFMEDLIFTPGHSLLTHLQSQELIEEEQRGAQLRAAALERRRAERKNAQVVHKMEEPAPIAAPVQVPSQPAHKPAMSNYLAFRQLCHTFADRCRAFLLIPSNMSESSQNHFRQNEYASNLLRNLLTLEELFSASAHEMKRPMVALETGERLALALEQAAKLACAILNLSETVPDKPEPILEKWGRECFWHAHAPLLLAMPIAKRTNMIQLNEEESAVLQSLACTAAITYRNPSSGNDRVTQALIDGNGTGNLLREGMKICLKILQCVAPADLYSEKEFVMDAGKLDSCMAPCSNNVQENVWQLKAEETLLRLRERLARIQQFRTAELNRQVPSLGKRDQSQKRRMGTIDGALKDLELNLAICEDILVGPEAPTLALTLTEASLSRQGAILAEVLLALLAHLPCKEKPGSTQHSLWTVAQKSKPLRYSHDLVEYAKRLPKALEGTDINLGKNGVLIQTMAEKLAPYLQQRHRYTAPNCEAGALRDKIADLSCLRRRVLIGHLSPAERQKLGDLPEQQLAMLDSHLRHVLLNEVKAPLVQTLEVVEQLLAIYETLLRK